MSKSSVVGALLLLASGVVSAKDCDKRDSGFGWFAESDRNCRVHEAPEVEIASAGAALALLVGGVIVLRGRKSRKKD